MLSRTSVLGLVLFSAITLFSFLPGPGKNLVEPAHVRGVEGIQFIESDWSKALQEAKKQNKLVFLDAYASWCGPCKSLKKYTFTNKEAGDYFNKNFINIAIDMEKGDGPDLSQKFGVDAYPTLIIADAEGNLLTYTKGYISPAQLIEFGHFGLSKKK